MMPDKDEQDDKDLHLSISYKIDDAKSPWPVTGAYDLPPVQARLEGDQPEERIHAFEACWNAAFEKFQRGDLVAAIDDLSRAIGIGEALRAATEANGKWRLEWRNNLASAYGNRGSAYWAQGAAREAIADYDRAIEIGHALLSATEASDDWRPDWLHLLALSYINRGFAYGNQDALRMAIADYDRAIGIGEALQSATEAAGEWRLDWLHLQGLAYNNRGLAHDNQGELRMAIADYARAIGIGEALRSSTEAAGDRRPDWLHFLALAYNNRGLAYGNQGELRMAIADYDRAIGIGEALRAATEAAGDWRPDWLHLLALAYNNRGLAYGNQGELRMAIADYDRAIGIGEALRAATEAAGDWRPEWQHILALANRNRGTVYGILGSAREAIADCGRAIGIGEALRAATEATGDWRLEWRNSLAHAYGSRGSAYRAQGAAREAIADYDQAIGIGEALRSATEAAGYWRPEWQHLLALAYNNRGLAYGNHGELREAIADYDRAIEIGEALRSATEAAGEWRSEWQHYLALAYTNRGAKYGDQGELREAIADYDRAIGIGEALRSATEATGDWRPEWQHLLALANSNRGVVYAILGAALESIADYNRAIGIGETLRSAAEASGDWQPEWRDSLANVYTNRGKAHSDMGKADKAIDDFSRAIGIAETLRAASEVDGNWRPDLRYTLASAYGNRGNAYWAEKAAREAIADYDRAIGIGEALRLATEAADDWLPEWRNSLAGTYYNRGVAYAHQRSVREAIDDFSRAIGVGEALRAAAETRGGWRFKWRNDLALAYANRSLQYSAEGVTRETIEDCDRAIAIGEELRSVTEPAGDWQAEWRDMLAGAYINRGNAYVHQGAANKAIADYNQAICTGEGLRSATEAAGGWRPEWRNRLALAYHNRGFQYSAHRAMFEAIADYDRAIAIHEALRAATEATGEWRPEWRISLARAFYGRGGTYRDQGATREAVADLDRAVGIGEALRSLTEPAGDWQPEWRVELAKTYCNRGVACADRKVTRDAMADFDLSIALSEPMLRGDVAGWFVDAVEPFGAALTNRSGKHLQQGNANAATDDADAALEKLRALEGHGVFRWRAVREGAFEQAIKAYVRLGNPGFVGEVILEHLNPDSTGAAPGSEAMHRAALDGLMKAIAQVLAKPGHQEELNELLAVAVRLDEIRALYFAGTAASAWLRATDRERTHGAEAGEAVLVAYTQTRPDDAEGFLRLAEYQLNHGDTSAAQAALLDAGRVVVAGGPADDARLRCVSDIAGRVLRLKLDAALPAILPADIKGIFGGGFTLGSWLRGDFTDAVLAETADGAWRASLGSRLDAVGHQEIEFQDSFFARFREMTDQADWTRAREKLRSELLNALIATARLVGEALPIPWRGFAVAIEAAWAELLAHYQFRPDLRLDAPEVKEKMAKAIADAVRAQTERLDADLVADFAAIATSILGAEPWAALTPSEQRFLAAAWRCRQEQRWRYAGLEIGLAVEHTLDHRIFRPLQQSPSPLPKADAPDFVADKLIKYFRGDRPLMLGEMIGALGRAITAAGEAGDVIRLVEGRLRSLPRGLDLLSVDPLAWKSRTTGLNRINAVRIACCHPNVSPQAADVEASWHAAIADEADAFFRYFARTLVQREGDGDVTT